MQTAETVQPDVKLEEEEDLKRLIRLVEESRVDEARVLAPQLAAKWPESQPIQHMARVLEPPKVTVGGKPGRSHKGDFAWLKEHAHEYPGCWLALYEGQLIAANPDRKTVVAAAREELGDEPALLFYQPSETE
jgi:hypothetical protein